jgi:hypothetical protein
MAMGPETMARISGISSLLVAAAAFVQDAEAKYVKALEIQMSPDENVRSPITSIWRALGLAVGGRGASPGKVDGPLLKTVVDAGVPAWSSLQWSSSGWN